MDPFAKKILPAIAHVGLLFKGYDFGNTWAIRKGKKLSVAHFLSNHDPVSYNLNGRLAGITDSSLTLHNGNWHDHRPDVTSKNIITGRRTGSLKFSLYLMETGNNLRPMRRTLLTTLTLPAVSLSFGQGQQVSKDIAFPQHYISVNPLNILLFQQAGIAYEYKPGMVGYGLTAGYIYPNHREYSNYFIAGPTSAGSLGDYYVNRKMNDRVNIYGGFVDFGYKCVTHHFFFDIALGLGILAVDHKMVVSAEWISSSDEYYYLPPKEKSTSESHFTLNFTLLPGGAF